MLVNYEVGITTKKVECGFQNIEISYMAHYKHGSRSVLSWKRSQMVNVWHKGNHKGNSLLIAVASQAMQIAMASFAFDYIFTA
jgi:hypothetical protein